MLIHVNMSAILLCVTFMFDFSVLAMQSGRNINATPFIPRKQQQQQEQQQRQQQQEHPNLYGSPQSQHQHPPTPQEHPNLYGSPPHQYQHQQPQIPPQYLGESNFYGTPLSPQQHHLPMPIQQFPPQNLRGYQQILPSSPPQFSPMADFSSSPQLMSPPHPSHFVRNEPDVGDKYKPMNLFDTSSSSSSNDPLKHLTYLLQTIPQGTSLFSETPIAIAGTPKQLKEPLNPVRTMSSSPLESSRITDETSAVNKEKITFGTIEESMLSSMVDKEEPKKAKRPENPPPGFPTKILSRTEDTSPVKPKYMETVKKPPSSPTMSNSPKEAQIKPKSLNTVKKEPEKAKRPEIPPGFPAKNPSETTDSTGKEVYKYLEVVKTQQEALSASKLSSSKEAQIKPKNPNTIESSRSAIPEVKTGVRIEGASFSTASASDNKTSSKKDEIPSSVGVLSAKTEGTSPRIKNPGFKPNEEKTNKGKQKDNNQGKTSPEINLNLTCKTDKGIEIVRTNDAPEEARTSIRVEFSPRNKGKQRKLEDRANSPSAAMVRNKFTELPIQDEELEASFVNKIKLESNDENVKDEKMSSDTDLKEETFVDPLSSFEAKDVKKKTAKQLKREKELADVKEIEKFAKKREQELEDAKGKAKAEETTEKIDEKSAKNKEKLKAAKDQLELHKNTNRVRDAAMNEILRRKVKEAKSKATKDHTHSMPDTSVVVQKPPVDHHTEIKTLLNILKYERIMGISIKNSNDEEQTKKDIRYLLYTVQVFYEALYKYWHSNYEFHDWNEYLYIGDVLTKIGQFYSNQGTNEENVNFFEKAKESFKKCMHFLSSFWIMPEYREFMESQVFSKDEGKYKFVKWMETLEQLLDALKPFFIKIKRFNQSNAKKNESLDGLKAHFEKSAIEPDFEKALNLKFRTIFGIVYTGMDKEQGFTTILSKKGLMLGLNYLQHWIPDQKANLAYIRKVMWHYFELMDYIKMKEIRADFKTYFQKIMGYPMPEGNYIDVERSKYANNAVYMAIIMVNEMLNIIRNGNPYKVSSEVQRALDAYKEHILCANFLVIMIQQMYKTLDEKYTKDINRVYMDEDERNFWLIVEKNKCIPAEENYRKVENLPEYQEFLQRYQTFFKHYMEEAIISLGDLYIKYNIEERRKEALGECDCCKPELGYEKDSEEENEVLGKEPKLEEADKEEEKEAEEKQEITQVEEDPNEATVDNESLKSNKEE